MLRFVVRGWPVPERLRRSVGRHMRVVCSGKLQPRTRQSRTELPRASIQSLSRLCVPCSPPVLRRLPVGDIARALGRKWTPAREPAGNQHDGEEPSGVSLPAALCGYRSSLVPDADICH